MSKKFFATLIVAVVATFAGYNIYQSQRTVTMSDLALVNVDALAQGEGSDSRSCYDTWRKAPDDDSLAYWAWICSECEAYWLLEASNKSTC
ncbi:NVEALA domain-containing protein [Bacteroides neonati]|uniref:NVEALA domain-containing protein n=1 Tax=Bacteroides neonati TaxID=1347393 RepID=UPI0005AA4940|nr:NVEALA domain-containing protein [Bacteroides neonati]